MKLGGTFSSTQLYIEKFVIKNKSRYLKPIIRIEISGLFKELT